VIEPGNAKRLKALEDQNVKLKKLLAEGMLDNTGIEEPAHRLRAADATRNSFNDGLRTTLRQAGARRV
jgi:hypothetical protein